MSEKQAPYMYSNNGLNIEKQRLDLLNQFHTPFSVDLMLPWLKGRQSVLEIGCGSGQLAAALAERLDDSVRLVATDGVTEQVDQASIRLSAFSHAAAHKIDFINDIDSLLELGPFDAIYCRWVLCHVPVDQQQAALKALISLLKPGGVFVMEDCDNRPLCFSTTNPEKQVLADKATQGFVDFYEPIAQSKSLNLQRDAQSQVDLLNTAGAGLGEAAHVGSYQVALDSTQAKNMVYYGKISSGAAYESMTGKSPQPYIDLYEQCAQDADIGGLFLMQHVSVFKRDLS